MLGYDPERVEVLLYQLVHLTSGGEQTRISKRRGDVVFAGRGYGHGVGLCQLGASGMARAGATFEEILKHYYTGVAVTPRGKTPPANRSRKKA